MTAIRAMLAERASGHHGELAASLLICLDRLEAIGGLDEVAAPLARAARLICFRPASGDRDEPAWRADYGNVPSRPASPVLPPPATTSTDRRALHDALESAMVELIFQADVQAYVDARQNELILLRAAHAVARAAAALAG